MGFPTHVPKGRVGADIDSPSMQGIRRLRAGDFFEFRFGFEVRSFYVLCNMPDRQALLVCRSSWRVSAAHSIQYAKLDGSGWRYLGRGRHRWWRNFLPVLRDEIAMYSPPHIQYGNALEANEAY